MDTWYGNTNIIISSLIHSFGFIISNNIDQDIEELKSTDFFSKVFII